jgi:hypothetical protein
MPLDPSKFGALAMALMEQLEQQHSDDAEVTAMVAIAAVRAPDGSAHISFRAADGSGNGLAPWHFTGLLDYVRDRAEE